MTCLRCTVKSIVYSAKCITLKTGQNETIKLPEFDESVISDENIIFHHVITVSTHSK